MYVHFGAPYRDNSTLILRRGATFRIFPPSSYNVSNFRFRLLAINPFSLQITGDGEEIISSDRNCSFCFIKGSEPGLEIRIPGDAKIGMYKVVIVDRKIEYDPSIVIIILFNPWSRNDVVYLGENQSAHNEYILNEQGYIWFSATSNIPTGKIHLFLYPFFIIFLFLFQY